MTESSSYMHSIKGCTACPCLQNGRPWGKEADGQQGPYPASLQETASNPGPGPDGFFNLDHTSAIPRIRRGFYFYSWEGLISLNFPNTPKMPLLNREPPQHSCSNRHSHNSLSQLSLEKQKKKLFVVKSAPSSGSSDRLCFCFRAK